ncbi:MAG: DinB family protein [Candidatus Promineifilaceae bacterium]
MSAERKRNIKARLSRSRARLLAAVEGLGQAEWAAVVYSEGETWMASDLLRHLADAERGMIRLVEVIRDGGEGVPADFDLNRWNASAVRRAQERTPVELLAQMEANRGRLLSLIDGLADEDWEKRGRHGSLRIMSVAEILALIALHERRHSLDLQRAVRAPAEE